MKKFVSLFLALIMIFTLASCGGGGGGKAPTEITSSSESGKAAEDMELSRLKELYNGTWINLDPYNTPFTMEVLSTTGMKLTHEASGSNICDLSYSADDLTTISVSLSSMSLGKYSIDTETGVLTHKPTEDSDAFTYYKEGSATPDNPSSLGSNNDTSDNSEMDENRYYGIGEAAEANGLSITIDGAEPFDYTGMISRPKDGFEYVKVWFTFTNASNEPLESPDKKDLYIIYEEGPTGDGSDMTSEENSQVLPDVADRNQRYMEDEIELSPGESVSGWMVYQRQTDISEVTMHYYSGFVNVAPDLRFRFSSPTGAVSSTSVAPEATTDTEPVPVVDYTGFGIDEITGTYEIEGMGKLLQIELYKAGDMMMMRFSDGKETEYEYDLNFGVATRYAEFDDGHTVLTILTFTRDEDTIHIAIDESLTYEDGSSKFGSYEGDRVY